jgi:hypothetical protein
MQCNNFQTTNYVERENEEEEDEEEKKNGTEK